MPSSFGRLIGICNAHSRAVRRALPEVERHLRARGLEHELRLTESAGDALRLARAALDEGHRFLVAIGGDGTVNEVVNALIVDDRARHDDSVLGVVEVGSGADFVRTFGIPSIPGHAVAHLDGDDSFPIDIGKLTYRAGDGEAVRYFANVAQAGLGARAAARAARLPRWLGPTLYPIAFWLALPGHRSAEVVVDLVDRTYEGPMDNLVVANGQFFGGGMKIAPRAAPTDGLLDLHIQSTGRREAIALLPKVYKGAHVPHPRITEAKRVRAALSSSRPLMVEADGEVLGRTPVRFEVLKEALRLKV
jgi:diacylglycerol kinase (ATP)